MKGIKIIVSLFMVITLTSCRNQSDFWEATINALEGSLQSNQYNEGNWQIGVEDGTKDHRSVTIRLINNKENVSETTMFSLQNKEGKKEIHYIYQLKETKDGKQYDQKVTLTSTNEKYENYDIYYKYQEFRNQNYFDGKEATGNLTVAEKDQITYDNVPLLKETLSNCRSLMEQFEATFNIDYSDYDFISLPELCKDIEIPIMNTIEESTSSTLHFYAEPMINAKGFSLVNTLEVDQAFTHATLHVYNVERQVYDSSVSGMLEKRGNEHCFNLVLNMDADTNYAIYFQQDTAFMYAQNEADQTIESDVLNHKGSLAQLILKTTNDSYQDVVVNP